MSDSRSLFSRLLGPSSARKDYVLAENYSILRDMVFSAKPDSLQLQEALLSEGIWGVVMETGYPGAVSTLVAIADGTVSLYFSNGGGIIGLGAHEGPKIASQHLIEFAPTFKKFCQPTAKFPLPHKDHVVFYLLTNDGTFSVEARESDLADPHHDLHLLYRTAHALITEIRLVDEKRQADEPAELLPTPGT